MPDRRGWWVGHSCPNCNTKVKTTNKHGHYTMHPDTAEVEVRHTIRACDKVDGIRYPFYTQRSDH